MILTRFWRLFSGELFHPTHQPEHPICNETHRVLQRWLLTRLNTQYLDVGGTATLELAMSTGVFHIRS